MQTAEDAQTLSASAVSSAPRDRLRLSHAWVAADADASRPMPISSYQLLNK